LRIAKTTVKFTEAAISDSEHFVVRRSYEKSEVIR